MPSLFKKLLPSSEAAEFAKPRTSTTNSEMSPSFDWTTTNFNYLSQEQEIVRLRGENQTLRREVNALEAQLEPSQETINELKLLLQKRDQQMERLAREIRTAVETYEQAIEIYEKERQERKPLSSGAGYTQLVDEVENHLQTWV